VRDDEIVILEDYAYPAYGVKKGFFPEGSTVLYAHLGGAPAINGYSYTYRNG
jgi:1-aminocyclopropane-1-carboxylate deaminase